MTRVVLIRHGRSTANAAGVLAGRAPGVALDDIGREQAAGLATILREAAVAAAFTSPVQRCVETAELAGFAGAEVVEALSECDYGAWTGSALEELRGEDVWGDIQAAPSKVRFPDGESMLEMFTRATSGVRDLAGRFREDETIVVFSHGDPIKAILADAFGMGLDDFQRLHVSPAGLSIVEYHGDRPLVVCVNAGGDLKAMLGAAASRAVGGGDVPGRA